MGSWASFRVILNRKCLLPLDGESLNRLVVQVDVRNLDPGRHGASVNRISVIVRADLDLSCLLIEDRLVAAAMAELELVGPRAQGKRQDLMAHAHAKERHLTHELPDSLCRIRSGGRIARAIGKEDTVRFLSQDV